MRVDTLQSVLESGLEARIVQINFNASFDRVNSHGILYKLRSWGIGGSMLPTLTQFLWSTVVVVNWLAS